MDTFELVFALAKGAACAAAFVYTLVLIAEET